METSFFFWLPLARRIQQFQMNKCEFQSKVKSLVIILEVQEIFISVSVRYMSNTVTRSLTLISIASQDINTLISFFRWCSL